ncbi:LAFE_0G01618g1_1 [Lachancea fermentati]|uniref:LAFE_0G01618g1_1 n=1 Tax=Lachancea fermentati TaxID=4955 RepID=A0A1G4MGM6_LACFM|nr:LAFE_0G01618g1_1 [Lachancea fermentati]
MSPSNSLRFIKAGELKVAYLVVGPEHGTPVILLHGFPYDVHAFDETSELLAEAGCYCVIPYLRGYGPTRFLCASSSRSGQQASLGTDLLALMDALKISKAVLGGFDWGGRAACVVSAIWPSRVKGLVSCGHGYNILDINASTEPLAPEQELRLWYQFYFHSERGRRGLACNRKELCELLWRLWSPTWNFSEATYAQTSLAFENPDFVDVVIHSYRQRFDVIPGDHSKENIERQLAALPNITVPTIVLEGEDDGVETQHMEKERSKFTNLQEHLIVPGIGHNFPQEAPIAFYHAIMKLVHMD